MKSTPKRNLPNNLDSSFPHSKPSPALLRQPLLIQDLTRVPGAGFGKIGESGFFGRLSCSVVPHAGSPVGLGEFSPHISPGRLAAHQISIYVK